MTARTFIYPVACVLVLAGLARGPLHRATFALPVSNDDAIPLLLARHLLRGELATTLWNQPYNGALDAYLLAPGLVLGPAHGVFRSYEAACAALLVVLVFVLARAVRGTAAGWAAAGLAAFGTPYMGLMTATGPPPNFLMPLVTGIPLAVALLYWPHSGDADDAVARPGPVASCALGLMSGLAVWNSSLAIPAFVGMVAGLVLAGARVSRHDQRRGAAFAAGAFLGASPLLLARLSGASGTSVVTAASAVTALRPPWLWPQGLSDLAHALAGLLGLQVPLVVDGPERAPLPLAVSLGLAIALVLLCGLGAQVRRALPLLGWAGALVGAFALSRRTGPDELRYLYGVNAPLLALMGIGAARLFARSRGAALVLGAFVLGSWGLGHRLVVDAWRDPAHAARV